ncbi:MAG TPA: carboxypeptidase regulatory-like domain-containing protein, partial [Burkholderiaceae bacterium]|nr:carboxypeptidase regulatory-like domain-containing protein [Burkholderiaceae bacterium]
MSGRILSAANGQPIAGAAVSASGVTTTTAADGSFTLPGLASTEHMPVTVVAAGYVGTVRVTPVIPNTTITVPTQLLPVATTFTPNVAAGATVSVPGSTAQVVFPANAIVDSAGNAPAQTVIARITPINPSQDPNLLPGDYRTTSNGQPAWIESFGALSVVLTDAGGGSYELAPGRAATIRIPATNRGGTLPGTVPLYRFDESTSLWVEEGTATLVGTAPNQYYEGGIARTGVWSASALIDTVLLGGCVRDVDGLPVRGASVQADGVTYAGLSSAVTDANGEFRI